MSLTLCGLYTPIRIDVGHQIDTITFTPNGDYLVTGGSEGVCIWQVRDGKRTAMLEAQKVQCLATSGDGRWIAAGTNLGCVLVWDSVTHQQVFTHREEDAHITITALDFSPDSTQLVIASRNHTATLWDVLTRERIRTLSHEDWVIAAKYSQGDRIATATLNSVRVWDGNDGGLLVDIPVRVTTWRNTGLVWFNNHLFVVSDNRIKEIDVSTGSTISTWTVPDTNYTSCIAFPRHGKFIAYSTKGTVTLWGTSTRAHLCHIPQDYDAIRSVALSLDDQYLAIAADDGIVIIKSLSHIFDSIPLSLIHPTLQDPEIRVDVAVLEAWKHDQLTEAEALLSRAILRSQNPNPHLLASRALIRARVLQWDAAILDANRSIKIQPSVMGYVAHVVALVGKGDMQDAYRVCDIAIEQFHGDHVTILLLIKAVVIFMSGEHKDAIARIDSLISTVRFSSTLYLVQAYMHHLLGNSCMESGDYEHAIQMFERARAQLCNRTIQNQQPFMLSLIFGWRFDDLDVTIQQRLCEALYAAGRAKEAGDAVLEIINASDYGVRVGGPTTEWVTDFMQQCLSAPDSNGSANDDVLALRLPPPLLRLWARLKLASGSWKDALAAAVGFVSPRFLMYRAICEGLEATDNISDAIACFRQMEDELAQEVDDQQIEWTSEFESQCRGKSEDLGDTAMNARQYDAAISHYTVALSLNPATPQTLFFKRSCACAERGLWEAALNDANDVIKLDPFSPLGYERKHAALHGAKCYDDAIVALETMLVKMSQSSDREICEQLRRYANPAQTEETIRAAVEDAIRDSPLILINTHSGRLLNKSEQALSFESQPIFKELISSMITDIDHTRIEHEVMQYYRYAMFSHRWEDNEPPYDEVLHVVVYDLDPSPTHDKLRMFCTIARDAGLNWAWSDTCCINKADHFILQEALVSMFRWYQGSALTIIFLLGVHRLSICGALVESIWNTRAWTLQEYHASHVVRFYTEDWTPYLNLKIYNHKESPEVISEMEEATGVSARALMSLCPGLDDIREKLSLASMRQTTRPEDAAYSLLGIFSMSLPVVYGEGDRSLGRLLAQLLTSSGDTRILAWTGRPGTFNSCLPGSINVFSQPPTTHIPPEISDVELETAVASFRLSSLNMSLVNELYEKLSELVVPSFVGQRLRLPCLTFKLGRVSVSRNGSEWVFRAQTTVLGVVEIKTAEDLSRLETLYLAHPWIDFLLDRHPVGNRCEANAEDNGDDVECATVVGEPLSYEESSNIGSSFTLLPQTRAARLVARLGRPFGGRSNTSTTFTFVTPSMDAPDAASLRPPSSVSPIAKQTRALQLLARLRHPFGALLLTPKRENVAEYKRIAAESHVVVRVGEVTPGVLEKLVQSVRTLDVL